MWESPALIKKIKLGAPKPPPKTSILDEEAERLKNRAVELKALNLYLAGYSPADIGEQLDPPVTALRAHQIVEKAIKAQKETAVGRIREREDMRLDALSIAIWHEAVGYTDDDGVVHPPNIKAMGRLLEIMDLKSKMHGLNSPAEIKLRDGITEVLSVVKKHAPLELYTKIIEELSQLDRSGRDVAARATGFELPPVGGSN